jgi:hypothetical protein
LDALSGGAGQEVLHDQGVVGIIVIVLRVGMAGIRTMLLLGQKATRNRIGAVCGR